MFQKMNIDGSLPAVMALFFGFFFLEKINVFAVKVKIQTPPSFSPTDVLSLLLGFVSVVLFCVFSVQAILSECFMLFAFCVLTFCFWLLYFYAAQEVSPPVFESLRPLSPVQRRRKAYIEFCAVTFSKREALRRIRSFFRGLRRADFDVLEPFMCMPKFVSDALKGRKERSLDDKEPLRDVFGKLNARRLTSGTKKTKNPQAKLPSDRDPVVDRSEFIVRDGNRSYNSYMIRELAAGKIDKICLVGTTRFGSKTWNFPVYCSFQVFSSFVSRVRDEPTRWRRFFLYGELDRLLLISCAELFHVFLIDERMCAPEEFKFVRVAGAVVALVRAVRKRDKVAFGTTLMMMSDVLGDFAHSFSITDLSSFHEAFPFFSKADELETEEEVVMLGFEEPGLFDYLPREVKLSGQMRAIASLSAAVCASAYLKDVAFVKAITESVDWSSLKKETDVLAASYVAVREISQGLNAVFACNDNWVTKASKFFLPPRWTFVVERGNELLRPLKTLKTLERLCAENVEIDEMLRSVCYENNAELTYLRPRLRDLKYENCKLIESMQPKSIPMVIFLYGAPGVGKTTLIDSLVGLLCKLDGVENAPGMVINVNVHDKYPASAGLNKDAHVLVFNDVPDDYTNFPQADKASLDLLLQQIVDTNVFYFRGAAIADKGVALCSLKYVIITSNNRNFKMVDATAKLIRRFRGAGLYNLDFADLSSEDPSKLRIRPMVPVATDKHLRFDDVRDIVYTRHSMIQNLIIKKHSYDVMEADRICKFSTSAVKCACGAAVEIHREDGVLRAFSEACDVAKLPLGNLAFYYLRRWFPLGSEVEQLAMIAEIEKNGYYVPAMGRFAFLRSFWTVFVWVPTFSGWTLLFHVIWEEVVKAVFASYFPFTLSFLGINFSIAGLVFGLFEYITAVRIGLPNDEAYLARFFVVCMHGFATSLPLLGAVVVHFAWNFAVITSMKSLVQVHGVGQLLPILIVFAKQLALAGPLYASYAFSLLDSYWTPFLSLAIRCLVCSVCLAVGSTNAYLFAVFYCVPFKKIHECGVKGRAWVERKIHLAYIATLKVDGVRIGDNPAIWSRVVKMYDSCSSFRSWMLAHKKEIAAAFTVGALFFVLRGDSKPENEDVPAGPAQSIFAKDVKPDSLRTVVISSEQQLSGLNASRAWAQRPPSIPKLVRQTAGAGVVDLEELCKNAVKDCHFTRVFAGGESESVPVKVFCLGPELLVFNRHFLYRATPKGVEWASTVRLTIEGVAHWYEFSDIVQDNETEVVFVKNLWPLTCKPLTKFLLESDFGNAVTATVILPDRSDQIRANLASFSEPFTKSEYNVWRWRGDVKMGDCGSPLIINGPDSALLGLVCMMGKSRLDGSNQAGAARLNKAIVERVLSKFSYPPVTEVKMTWLNEFDRIGSLSDLSELRNVDSPYLLPVGTVNANSRSFKSRFKPTVLYSAASKMLVKDFACPTAVRGLKDGAWLSAVMHTFKHVNLPDESTLGMKRRACRAYLNDCLRNKKDSLLAPLTLSEAIFGRPEIGIERVVFKTSVGPSLKTRGISNKYDLFIRSGDELSFDERVRQEVDDYIGELREGIISPVRTDMTPKDEVRDRTKVETFKIRLFSVVDFVYNITLRMYSMPIITFLLHNRFDSGIFGYMNAGSPEWGKLVEWLVAPGGAVFDMDFSGFDTSHSGEMFHIGAEFFYDAAVEFGYDSEWAACLYFLVASLCVQIAAYMLDVFVKLKGLPSGVIVTLILNSIINGILMRMAFSVLCPEIPLGDFRKHVHEAMVGDDNVCGVSDAIKDRFNAVTIFSLYKKWGYVATPAIKEGEVRPYVTIKDVSFVKRRFRFDVREQLWFAPLEEDSIWKALCFQRSDAAVDPYERLLQVAENAQREFFLYGKEVFLEKQAVINSMFNDADLTLPRQLSYEYLIEEFRSGTFRTEDL